MKLTSEESRNVEVLHFVLDKFKNSTITIEYHCDNPKFGGVKFDREISECIKNVLSKALEEQKADQ